MTTRPTKLFIGVGHLLKRDDGVGVRAAEIMAGLPLPSELEVFDAGMCGWDLACVLEDRDLVVIVDAVDAGAEPGRVFRFTPDDLRPAHASGLSLHDFHVLDALEETKLIGRAPRRVVIFAVQPEDLSSGIGLSAPAEAGLWTALTLAIKELGLPTDLLEDRAAETTLTEFERIPR